MTQIDIATIAEALMRSTALRDKKIAAIKILRDAAEIALLPEIGLKEAKTLIDEARERVDRANATADRLALARRLLNAAADGPEGVTFAVQDFRVHVQKYGPIDLLVTSTSWEEF